MAILSLSLSLFFDCCVADSGDLRELQSLFQSQLMAVKSVSVAIGGGSGFVAKGALRLRQTHQNSSVTCGQYPITLLFIGNY